MDKPELDSLKTDMISWQEAAQKQVDDLCAQYQITTQKSATGFAQAEFGTHVGSLISIPDLQEESDYITALHEVAHVVFELHTSLFADESKEWMYADPKEDQWGCVIHPDDQAITDHIGEEEAWCWNWSFEQSQVPITREIYDECHESLMTYHTGRVDKTGPAFKGFEEFGHQLQVDQTLQAD